MLYATDEEKQLYAESCQRHLILTFEDGDILENDSIFMESMELEQTLCDENELTFGKCSAACFKVRIINTASSHKGQRLIPTLISGSYSRQLGVFWVDSDSLTADKRHRDIVAYDVLFKILNTDMSIWYKTMPLPMSLRTFRNSFFEYFGITQGSITLPNDDMLIERTIDPEKISGADIIQSVCELNACFGNIGHNGKFRYVFLKTYMDVIYPADDLYPSEQLFPSDEFDVRFTRSGYKQGTLKYEDFRCQQITQIQIRQEENDIGVIAGTEGNAYVIEDNFLVYGKGTRELAGVAERILEHSAYIPWNPASLECRGRPWLETGDYVKVIGPRDTALFPVLHRTLKGICALMDTYEAKGTEYYSEKVNGIMCDIKQLKGKSNVLERSIEETRSTITDLGEGLQSTITQTAEEIRAEVQKANDGLSSRITQTVSDITTEVSRATDKEGELSGRITITENNISSKVSKGDVCSTINQSSDAISVKSNRFSLQSDNLTITAKGNITARNGTITAASITNGDPVKGDSYFTLQDDGTLRVGFISVGKGGVYNAGKLQNVKDIETDANLYANFASIGSGGIYTTGNLTAAGGKSRVVRTENYADRLLYCYETPAPLFGDIGSGILDEHGECCIAVDDVFSETIQTVSYHVFLTQYGRGDIYVAERTPAYFLVRGTPGLEFSWELKAKQRDFEAQRLDAFRIEEPEEGIDYEVEAEKYLNQLQEVMKYE